MNSARNKSLAGAIALAGTLLWLAAPTRAEGDEPAASAPPAGAVVNSNVEVPESGVPDVSWVPPPDDFDWIQLKSGEWLKGRIKVIQDRKLEFDSEELDNLTFEWKKIRQVRSAREVDVLFVDQKTVRGRVMINPEVVVVTGGAESQSFPREGMQSLTPAGSRERDYWSGKLTAGYTMRKGNTNQQDFTAQAHLQRSTPITRVTLDYIGNASSVSGAQTTNNNRVNSELDVWLSKQFYLVVPFGEYYVDPYQNLAYRATAGAGVGYDIIDHPKLEWSITAGPAYQKARFDNVEADQPEDKEATAFVLTSRFDWDITQRIDLILEYRGQYTSKAIGETTHHAVGTLSLELTKRFDIDFSLVWDRISEPKAGSDGIQPKPDDFRLVAGVGLDF
jgi:putative salt-induced outer membrane protein YdiY